MGVKAFEILVGLPFTDSVHSSCHLRIEEISHVLEKNVLSHLLLLSNESDLQLQRRLQFCQQRLQGPQQVCVRDAVC